MAIVISKGTVLQQEISTVFVAIAQVTGIDLPDIESETFESDTLDNANAGIPHAATGRTEGGTLNAELFFDPALAGHQSLLALLTTPADQDYKLIFADVGATEWAFTGAGLSFGGTVALSDGLKGNLGIKLDGIPTGMSA